MFGIFKAVGMVHNVKKGIEKPDELLFETVVSFIGMYFTISFIILGVLATASGYFGFTKDIMALKLLMVLFLIGIGVSLLIFIWVKGMIRRASKKIARYAEPHTQYFHDRIARK